MTESFETTIRPTGQWRRFVAWLGRLWRRLCAALRGPTPLPQPPLPPPPPPGRLVVRRRWQRPVELPAKGYVHHFLLHAVFVWTSDGLPREALHASIQEGTPYVSRELIRRAAGLAREHPAHQARKLEESLQRALAEQPSWSYDGGRISCRPYVWVRLEKRVEDAIRPYWEDLIKLDCAHRVDMRRAEYADKLSERWTEILTRLASSDVAGGAARLTEAELAEVMRDIVAERQAAQQRLDDMMADGLRSEDPYERAAWFDSMTDRRGRSPETASGR